VNELPEYTVPRTLNLSNLYLASYNLHLIIPEVKSSLSLYLIFSGNNNLSIIFDCVNNSWSTVLSREKC